MASWVLICIACAAALIPGIGFVMWIVGIPVLLVTFILGIVAISKGSTGSGVAILLTSLIVAPAVLMVGPLVTTSMFMKAADDASKAKHVQPTPSATQAKTL
jgi:hypothetical protein